MSNMSDFYDFVPIRTISGKVDYTIVACYTAPMLLIWTA